MSPVLLALDTSTLTLSLALVERRGEDVRAVEHVVVPPPEKQSEALPGVVGELLQRHGLKLQDLEGLAVGLGPGSFTGLRIGLATVKALAYATGLKVAGASSLAAVALEGPEGVPLFCLAVARKDDLYLGAYRRVGHAVEALAPETAMSPEEVAQRMAAEPEAVALGPALADYRQALEKHGVAPHRLLSGPAFPSAVEVGRLARLPEAYSQQALFALEPHYVRASEPERNPKFPPLPGPAPTARLKED
ncbi:MULTISPECIES: tRNA (adenosine(37)-N6)-threonylcarbamoyltransferase complex dimerization subunit type 1 TsaB [Corallococcus]|uniref:tRNA (adenosine(37)-N6)-threonylcarbamoyltransferase complex dimerization subunit type 1 TsaB n=1 Tax=Corallococcus TaxID=83461 RepID=UPI00117EC548|nr:MULTISPECIES: tRNA (adenosine(37)-N6)-threonylcarbamoyltransferase complex dimerization subunit type 1 TsaB [Corallococcus]NBD08542.1 tRNA (adenosine(37)-N6)-threonylcarbamoyltransferase complex dimerization subunit type 1 TsaB [Corallococcus silvisoli]TSC33143.1 tRNA (adenosine(37)-N6)-threonylcarbamoyltransferase complex dimerization subunit type 1 TsaB [Corallococcus sp. Z5C101001]